MNTKQLNINEDIFNQIQQYCDSQGISMQYWAETLFCEYLENSDNCKEPNKELIFKLLNKRIEEDKNGKFYTSIECKEILNKEFNICL